MLQEATERGLILDQYYPLSVLLGADWQPNIYSFLRFSNRHCYAATQDHRVMKTLPKNQRLMLNLDEHIPSNIHLLGKENPSFDRFN